MWQREGDMGVGNRQEFVGRGGEPFFPSRGLALGTSAIAAGLENEVLVGTVITLLEACAQSGGSACADVSERLALMGRRVWPHRARNSCWCWRKTSATSSRCSITAGGRHPRSS